MPSSATRGPSSGTADRDGVYEPEPVLGAVDGRAPRPRRRRTGRVPPRILHVLALMTAVAFAACEASSIVSAGDDVPVQISIVATGQTDVGPLFVGESLVLVAELRDRRGRLLNGRSIKWESSNTQVAVIDNHGELTAVGGGTTTIEASHRNLFAETELAVVDVVSLELSPARASLEVGETLVLQVEAVGSDGASVDPSRLRWRSSDASVAAVESGTVTALRGGSSVIEVEAGGQVARSEIEVTPGEGDPPGGQDPGGSAWPRTVKFKVGASSSFDTWTRDPTPEQQEWMREHYFRMVTYSSYFGPRLAWYPNALVYKDAYAIYRSSELVTEHPEWILRDAAGNPLYIPYGCSGGTCPQYAADFGNPDFRRHWIGELRETLADGYLGVMVDDVNMLWRVGDGNGDSVRPRDPRTGQEMTLADWRRYLAEFMEEIRAAFPDKEISHNAIWYADPDDPFVQRQTRAANYISLERGATDRGIRGGGGTYGYETFLAFIDRVHAGGGSIVLDDDDSDTDSEWIYELATYLLVKAGNDMLAADGDRSRMNPDNFWEGYLIELGDPLGPRYKVDGLFRRDYQCGVAVLNQPDQPTRTLTLSEPYLVVGGGDAKVSSVTLPEYRGAVLVREGCTP